MSLKHVVHKRVHKERHQPAARQKLGYLEKHKDYVKRARDFHRKEDTLKKMHQKAYFKNQDEFAFSMLSHSRKADGRLSKDKAQLAQDEMHLLDSQDARYIGLREQVDKKAIEKRAAQLHFLEVPAAGGKHTVFVDDDDDIAPPAKISNSASSGSVGHGTTNSGKVKKLKDFDVAAYFDTHPALLGKRSNRLRMSQLESQAVAEPSKANMAAYKELFARQERVKKLRRVREELDLRANLRGKGRRMKVSDGGKDKVAVYKWLPERKR
jgi:U3 small nucleolar RNA-associated protein 11